MDNDVAKLGALVSETRNPASMNLDTLTTLEMVTLFNQQDHLVPQAISHQLPAIAAAVDLAAAALAAGGRLIYLGAGTSGRLGVLDAAECPPTFGVPSGLVVGLIAGGPGALLHAVEGAEDDLELAAKDLLALNLQPVDMVVGLAASGRTPYVIGGLRYATRLGCATAAISCNPDSPIAHEAGIAISPLVGPEVLTGSTRMKSGTAQKLILNMLSTGAMVKLGKVYQNLMVDVKATNIKLADRACRIVVQATGADRAQAQTALEQADFEVKTAILMILTGVDATQARRSLSQQRGFLRCALGDNVAASGDKRSNGLNNSEE
ncbi:N-acetylmuramic acid 6-phosphate etherase [Acerihabitans sp. TG2]|uniref:N-acetylmuramic acid 6-phosphate etherase n=1 Tax=Acerihabitans sp. TG2 TaxID=3096008 RepID=UPI002B236F8F|nr:N-acetylmuramic acid 6-phosphate etherase [Acerihabitans sp. TG2]MEA9392438.1 N-acetylmuramic acid 6-phosphate etherase [Acerihabitans sp. TG2]